MKNPEISADADLEFRINTAALKLAYSRKQEDRRAAWDELCRLHALRSPERVREMELDKRIRR